MHKYTPYICNHHQRRRQHTQNEEERTCFSLDRTLFERPKVVRILVQQPLTYYARIFWETKQSIHKVSVEVILYSNFLAAGQRLVFPSKISHTHQSEFTLTPMSAHVKSRVSHLWDHVTRTLNVISCSYSTTWLFVSCILYVSIFACIHVSVSCFNRLLVWKDKKKLKWNEIHLNEFLVSP